MKPNRRQKAGVLMYRVLPRRSLSRTTGAIARIRLPESLRSPVLKAFSRMVGIDHSQAEKPLAHYRSVNEFFTRRLARPFVIDSNGEALVSPAEGYLTASGKIENGMALQAKGRSYSVATLVQNPEDAKRLEGGWFSTVYLTPRNYHRVHSPTDGKIVEARVVPGTLFPVFPAATETIPDLFVRNERLVIKMDTSFGLMFVVLIGAANVGAITTAFDSSLKTNRILARLRNRHNVYDPAISIKTGEELATFNLGSSVVVLWADSNLVPTGAEGAVCVGETIATLKSQGAQP